MYVYFRGEKNLVVTRTACLQHVVDAIRADEIAYRVSQNAERRELNRSLGVRKWWHGPR